MCSLLPMSLIHLMSLVHPVPFPHELEEDILEAQAAPAREETRHERATAPELADEFDPHCQCVAGDVGGLDGCAHCLRCH